MQDTKVAKRYAHSLFLLAKEQDVLERVYQDLILVSSTLKQSKELRMVLSSPVINKDKKLAILDKIFGAQLSMLTYSFIRLITEKTRERHLLNIAEGFISEYKTEKGITTAHLRSAQMLTPEAKAAVLDKVKKEVGGEVELHETVDPDLIGGFVLRVGDKQIDTSILNELNRLRKNFSKNLYVKDF